MDKGDSPQRHRASRGDTEIKNGTNFFLSLRRLCSLCASAVNWVLACTNNKEREVIVLFIGAKLLHSGNKSFKQ